MRDRIEWMKNLQVGDVVCDCRYHHTKIVKIYEEWYPRGPRWLRRLLFKLPDFFLDTYENLCERLGFMEIYNKQLELEDGFGCSAMDCCDPPDHDEDIHAEAIEATRKWNEDPEVCDVGSDQKE